MDVHKPKPWHGLREFLKEYVIIVVGVLTALGAEQAVEWLHWRHLASRAEQELAAGLQADVVNATTEISVQPCFQAWLAPIAAGLQASDPVWHGRPLPPGTTKAKRLAPIVFAAPGYIWSHAAWENAAASGVLNHMPEDRVQRYAEVYREVDLSRTLVTAAADTGDQLAPLGIDRRLSESEKAGYLQAFSHLQRIIANQARLARSILQEAHALGVDPPADQVRARRDEMRRFDGDCVGDPKAEGPP